MTKASITTDTSARSLRVQRLEEAREVAAGPSAGIWRAAWSSRASEAPALATAVQVDEDSTISRGSGFARYAK